MGQYLTLIPTLHPEIWGLAETAVGALKIRIWFGSILYFDYDKPLNPETLNPILIVNAPTFNCPAVCRGMSPMIGKIRGIAARM